MRKILIDIFILTASIYLAVFLVHDGAIDALLAMAQENVLLVSFVAGIFFTSVFTTPPSIAVFAELSGKGNIFIIALMGGAGAVLGDSLFYFFVREKVSKDASALMSGPRWKRLLRILRKRRYRRILPVLGALIIASPLPDELGLALIGVSNIKRSTFFLLSFSMNVLGIFFILLTSRII